MKPSIGRNALFSVGARGIPVLLTLVSTPIILGRIGLVSYGIYMTALTIGGILGVLDLGLTPALVASLAHASAQGDNGKIQRDAGTALTLFIGIGCLGALAFACLVPWLVSAVLHVPGGQQAETRIALWISAADFALGMPVSVFEAVPPALERYSITAGIVTLTSACATIISVAYCLTGGDLIGLMAITLAANVVGMAASMVASRRVLPSVPFRPGFDIESLKYLGRFSLFKASGSIAGIISYRFDQFAIGAILGVKYVPFYAIPANVALQLSTSLVQVAAPVYPRVSRMMGDRAALRQLYFRWTYLVFGISSCALFTTFMFADLVLKYWFKGQYGDVIAAEGSPVLRWLLAAFLIQAIAAIPGIFAEAMQKPEINNGFAIVGAMLNVPLVLFLVPRLGIAGAAIALFMNSATQTAAFILFASWRLVGISPWLLCIKSLCWPTAVILPSGLLALLLRGVVHDSVTLIAAMSMTALGYSTLALSRHVSRWDRCDRVSQAVIGERIGQAAD